MKWATDWSGIVAETEEELADPDQKAHLYDRSLELIAEALDDDPADEDMIVMNLEEIETWRRKEVMCQIWNGDSGGWKSPFSEWVAITQTHFRLVCDEDAFDRSEISGHEILDTLAAVCLGLVTGHKQFLKWCSERFLEVVADEEINYVWTKTCLLPFLADLVAMDQGVDFDAQSLGYDLGPYQAVFDGWESEEKLGQAIHEICRYHDKCQRSKADAFDTCPLAWMPLDIMALERVRTRQGLWNVEVDDKELDTPFYLAPDRLTARSPAWLKNLEKQLLD